MSTAKTTMHPAASLERNYMLDAPAAIRQQHHTQSVAPEPGPEPGPGYYVSGYNGLYNLRHSFWVEPGSRVYGPKPHMTLNISQDLFADFEHRMVGLPHHHLLLDLLEKPETPTCLRIFSALRWFNAANESGLGQSQALLNLAVAFESLLRLPESSKTDRLVDAISLLLGRTERLGEWAKQFYDARSRVVHEGEVRDQYFYPGGTSKRQASGIFGSLMLNGRQISAAADFVQREVYDPVIFEILVTDEFGPMPDNKGVDSILEEIRRRADVASSRLDLLDTGLDDRLGHLSVSAKLVTREISRFCTV